MALKSMLMGAQPVAVGIMARSLLDGLTFGKVSIARHQTEFTNEEASKIGAALEDIVRSWQPQKSSVPNSITPGN
jgi:hypothetical protein